MPACGRVEPTLFFCQAMPADGDSERIGDLYTRRSQLDSALQRALGEVREWSTAEMERLEFAAAFTGMSPSHTSAHISMAIGKSIRVLLHMPIHMLMYMFMSKLKPRPIHYLHPKIYPVH